MKSVAALAKQSEAVEARIRGKVSDTPVPPAMARILVVSCFDGSRAVP
jgi:hypothetical protein